MKEPWLAAILNFLFAGVGYLYLGTKTLLATLVFLTELMLVAWYISNIEYVSASKYSFLFQGFSFLFSLAVAVDGYMEGKRVNSTNKLRNKSIGVKRKIMLFGFLLTYIATSTFFAYQMITSKVSSIKRKPVTLEKNELTNLSLMQAINEERRKNQVQELAYEPSSCYIAKLRADILNEYGISTFQKTSTLQLAIEKAFEENPSLLENDTPDYYYEVVTYQLNANDAIKDWKKNDAKELFTSEVLSSGCVVVQDGYGIVITGYDESKEESTEEDPAINKEDVKLLKI